MTDSIFTKIIKGEIPAHKVYEDERTLAFLDIQPFTYGHTLVIPKQQTDHLWDLDDKLYLHIMEVAKRIAERQRKILNPPRVGIIVEGFAVSHAHVHVFPMYEGIEATIEHEVEKPDNAALKAMAAKLKFSEDKT